MLKYDGEQLTGPFSAEDATSIPSAVSRVKLQCAMHAYAVGLGISFRFGKNIEQYLDDPVHPKAVAVTKTGERFEADVIVAADGVGSKSWQLVQGTKTKAQSSGFAIYRVAFPTEIAHRDPEVAKAFPTSVDGLDAMRMYLGPETHAITMTSKETMNWLLTHKVRYIYLSL